MSTTVEADVYPFMRGSHQALESDLSQLLQAVTVEDQPTCHALWVEVEHRLLAHMEAEERFVLPEFAKVDQAAAISLLREHGVLREHLLELGIALELHTLRVGACEAFASELRRHAAREDELLYHWAAQRLDPKLVSRAAHHINSTSARDA